MSRGIFKIHKWALIGGIQLSLLEYWKGKARHEEVQALSRSHAGNAGDKTLKMK